MQQTAYGRADGEGGVVQLTVENELRDDDIYGAIVRSPIARGPIRNIEFTIVSAKDIPGVNTAINPNAVCA